MTFRSCLELSNINFSDSLISIGDSAFYNCNGLENLSLSPGTKFIGDGAFELCDSLREITIPGSVTTIGKWAFKRCKLESVTIPNSVESIGKGAFSDCRHLSSVSLPSSIKRINPYTFNHCTSLEEITIPESVINIGGYAFNECTNLSKVEFAGDNITGLEDCIFLKCSKLKEITIPNSVSYIGVYAFNLCENLTKVSISGKATNIGEHAFLQCNRIMEIYYPAEHPLTTAQNNFEPSVYQQATLFVPESSIAEIETTVPWGLFYNIKTYDFHGAVDTVDTDCENTPVEYYDLKGIRVTEDSLVPGLYIKRQGNKTEKVVIGSDH